jgi:hypothetical protein
VDVSQLPQPQPLPGWASKVLRHLQGLEAVGRVAVVDAAYLAVLVLVIWFVVGLIAGFLSLSALFGAGGLGAVAKVVGNLFTGRVK